MLFGALPTSVITPMPAKAEPAQHSQMVALLEAAAPAKTRKRLSVPVMARNEIPASAYTERT